MPHDDDLTVDDEVRALRMGRPHLVLLGAGASRAATPKGDRNGRQVPLLKEVAADLDLARRFPADLRGLAVADFEAAYSKLFDRRDPVVAELNELIRQFFIGLRLPDEPNLYDYLNLSLRAKDVIFTFNWDPLIVESQIRLYKAGMELLPKVFALHGNVAIGYCEACETSGIGLVGEPCKCGGEYRSSPLLFPVEHKDYISDPFINREWRAMRHFLSESFMFTVFGYSAPATDVEAVDILKGAWGSVEDRNMEQTEIIDRPGSDPDELRSRWEPFIHTHHYDVFENFFDSWLARHPRRSGEAYMHQYLYAQFISDHNVPRELSTMDDLVGWFEPLLQIERPRQGEPEVGNW